MELKIFNSILFTELRPWLPKNQNESDFQSVLRKLRHSSPENSNQLFSNLKILLSDYPGLADFRSANLKANENHLFKSFYQFDLPPYFNNVTEFYSALIKFESERILNNFIAAIESASHNTDKYFNANQAWKNVRNIIELTTEELTIRGLTVIPIYKRSDFKSAEDMAIPNIHFVLYLVRLFSIRLFLEIQILFKDHLKTVETELHLYINVLKESPPENSFTLTQFYFEWLATNLMTAKQYDQDALITLMNEIKYEINDGNTGIKNVLFALENYICFNLFNLNIKKLQFANFANPAISATSDLIFDSIKQAINKIISQQTYGHQRLDIIQTNLDKLSVYTLQVDLKISSSLNSAPRKLYQWLVTQKSAYINNLTAVFSPEPDPEEEQKSKSNPLPKKNRLSLDESKAIALENLKFMSGVNVHQEEIMKPAVYNRMLDYTFRLIEFDKVPSEISKIPQINISTEYIRFSFYNIHKSLYGTHRIKEVWINFLHKVFSQFDNSEWNTTKTKFSVKPPYWDSDMRAMKK
jgi:hypothetical protein